MNSSWSRGGEGTQGEQLWGMRLVKVLPGSFCTPTFLGNSHTPWLL